MSQGLAKAICPVCGEWVSVRNGMFVYHKWLLAHGGRRVPCSGVGRQVKNVVKKES